MARYTVQSPSGKRITLEGDTPPTKETLDQVFGNKVTPGDPEEVSKLSYEQRKELMSPAEKTAVYGLRGVQALGGMIPSAGPVDVSSWSTTPVTEFMIQRMEKRTPKAAFKEAGVASAFDLGVGTVLPAGSTLAYQALKYGKKAAKPAAKAILKQGKAGANVISDVINKNLGLKHSDLAKDIAKGNIDFKNIMPGTGEQKIIKAGENISEILRNGRKIIGDQLDTSIKTDLSKKLGRGVFDAEVNQIQIASTNTRKTVKAMIDNIQKTPIKSEQSLTMLKQLKGFKRQLGRTRKFNYGDLKDMTKNIYGDIEGAAMRGDSTMANNLRRLGKAMTKDKNSDKIIAKANKPYRNTARWLDALQDTTGVKLKPVAEEGLDTLMTGPRPLPMRLRRLTSEYRAPQLKALEKIEKGLKRQKGFEGVTFVDDLKAGLVNELLDKSSKAGLPGVPFSGKIPFVKEALSPHAKAKLLYSGISKGTNLADQPVSSMFPLMSSAGRLAGAKLGKTGRGLTKAAILAGQREARAQ